MDEYNWMDGEDLIITTDEQFMERYCMENDIDVVDWDVDEGDPIEEQL